MNTNKAKILFAIFLSFTIVTGCKSDPKETRDKAFSKAQEHMAKEEYESAIIEFRNALKADSGHVNSYMGLGEAFEKMGDIKNADTAFKQVIKMDSKNVAARLKLGEYRINLGLFKDALDVAEEIVDIDPSNVDGIVLKGNACLSQKKIAEAIQQYEEALSFDSNNLKALLGLAAAKAADDNLQEAEIFYKRAIEKHPDDIGAHLGIALFYASQNRSEETLKFLKQAFELDPADSRSLSLLAGFYISQQKPAEAENVFKAAIERKPGERLPLMGLADFYLKQGNIDAGIDTLNRLLASFPEDAPAQLLLAKVFIGKGEEEKGEDYIRSVLKSDAQNAQAHFMLGTILRRRQALDKAFEEFDRAIGLNASMREAYLEKANIELLRGDLDSCGATLQSVLQVDGNWLPARGALAKLLVLRGRSKDALLQAQGVLDQDLANEDALGARAEALRQLGRFNESKKDWLKLCELRPGNASYRHRLGIVEAMQKDYTSALNSFRKALELKPDFVNAIKDIVGIHIRRKQYNEALAELDRIAVAESIKDEIHRFRGQVFQEQQDEASAEKEWEKAISINPQNLAAYVLLGQMYQRQNKLPQAIKRLDQLIARIKEKDSQDDQKDKLSAVYLQKAYFLQLSKDNDGAEVNYRKALELNSGNVIALNNLAWILAEGEKNLEEALSLAKEAKKKVPEDPEIADTLGWIYYKMKNYPLAENQLILSVNNRKDPGPRAEHYYRLGMAIYKRSIEDKDRKEDFLKAKQTLRKALELNSTFEGAEEAREILKREG